ncbi:phosphoribosylanthranilate isomerase [Butyrivibrio sp. VCB2006]|uniref:phosphoribosylanthranilate isomerase n=1 Tax=Butyrivibrio sp. VCB2006 TaxID=1280679 RepID=UPI000414E2FE|nr:phosphoribosylanthranilate isomerase [Butyrivibrio sp. VCB2006]
MTAVKMCGLYREEDILFVNKLKPEYIGFVFYKKSHRYVDLDTANHLKSLLDKDIKAVGVFVNEDISFIKELVDKKIIDVIQLHGSEDLSYVSKLRQELGNVRIPIIKALVIKTKDDFSKYEVFCSNSSVDYYLLDSGMGSGSSFDWNLVKELNKPIFLAGGLDADNVSEAIKRVNPFAVDVSSGIETEGIKDFDKMTEFISKIRC